MGVTSPDNISYPDQLDDFDYVGHFADQAQSVQDALTKMGNAYVGTPAERTAFTTTAPEGALWSDTTGDKMLWQFRDGKWYPEYEFVPIPGNGTVALQPVAGAMTGVHVYSFGRLAVLTGEWTNTKALTINKRDWFTLGTLPTKVRPSGTGNARGTTSASTPSSGVMCRVHASSNGVLHFMPTDNNLVFNSTAGSGDIAINGLTWPLAS